MKTIDLSKVSISMLDGSVIEQDIAKDLAQIIFQNTQNINEHDFCMNLYKNPVIELTDENTAIVQKYMEKGFMAFAQVAVNKMIEEAKK